MEPVRTIEIRKANMPILHSEYLDWTIHLATTSKKNKKNIYDFYRSVLSIIHKNEECIPEFLRIIVNGKAFTYDLALTLDLKSAIHSLNKIEPSVFQDERILCTLEPQTSKLDEIIKGEQEDASTNYLQLLEKIEAEASNVQYPFFYYHQIPIAKEILFEKHIDQNGQTYLKIRSEWMKYLRYLDLSQIVLEEVDIRGLDLSYTNIKGIKFETLYQRSIEGTNLNGVSLINHDIHDVCAVGANLQKTFCMIDIDTVNLDGAVIDDSVFFYSGKHGKITKVITKRSQSQSDISTPIIHF